MGTGKGFDFVCEALDIGFGGAFGLFGFGGGGGRLRVGVVPVHQIAAAVEFRVMQAPHEILLEPRQRKRKKARRGNVLVAHNHPNQAISKIAQ